MEFGFKHRNGGIVCRHRGQSVEPGAIEDIHVLSHRDLPHDGVEGPWAGQKPKLANSSLLRGAPVAVEAAQLTNLIEIPRPDFGIECWRRRGAELRAACHYPRCHRADS